jgi:hydrogenase maturation protease
MPGGPASIPVAAVAHAGRRRPRVLVAGLGNPLMGDDGVGVAVCRAWLAERPRPSHYLVAEVGTAIYSALHLLEWADRILIVDAMQAGGPPGALYLAGGDDLEVAPAGASLHGMGLLGALSLLRSTRRREVRVLGVEPETLRLGTELSAPVAAAVPTVVRWGKRLLAEWSDPPGCGTRVG